MSTFTCNHVSAQIIPTIDMLLNLGKKMDQCYLAACDILVESFRNPNNVNLKQLYGEISRLVKQYSNYNPKYDMDKIKEIYEQVIEAATHYAPWFVEFHDIFEEMNSQFRNLYHRIGAWLHRAMIFKQLPYMIELVQNIFGTFECIESSLRFNELNFLLAAINWSLSFIVLEEENKKSLQDIVSTSMAEYEKLLLGVPEFMIAFLVIEHSGVICTFFKFFYI